MALLRLKLKTTSKKMVMIIYTLLVVILLLSRFDFLRTTDHLSDLLWLTDNYNSASIIGYGIPLIYVAFLTLLENNHLLNSSTLARLPGRWALVRSATMTAGLAALIVGSVSLVTMFLIAPTTLFTGWQWSRLLIHEFKDFFQTNPELTFPLQFQCFLFTLQLVAYLTALGLLFEIIHYALVSIRLSFAGTVLLVFIQTTILKNGLFEADWLPARFYIYYFTGASRQSIVNLLSYWLVALASLTLVLTAVIMRRKQVSYG
ncbi:hypothetical protein [Lapidilactobacillus bayanensis]|uniref:hypothetical protein n=1 Tax=Lapidilactobacillus bayanensis TaxID=2485998 RepID=UPI000F76BC5A|nr:hypothetical protein [Lapidilactobacillus bayanensis]